MSIPPGGNGYAGGSAYSDLTPNGIDESQSSGGVLISAIEWVSTSQTNFTVTIPAAAYGETASFSVGNDSGWFADGTAQIGCAATIASVSPNLWYAGKSKFVTITGTGFITPPNATSSCPVTKVTATAPDGTVTVSSVSVNSATSIVANVEPASTAPTEGATLTVSGAATPSPNADILGAPIIKLNGQTISGPNAQAPNPEPVVGQALALTTTPDAAALAALPIPLGIASSTWTVTGGTNIGGYTPTSTSYATGSVKSMPALNTPNLNFYSVESGANVVETYQLCTGPPSPPSGGGIGSNACNPTATASLAMSGPEGASFSVTSGPFTPAIVNNAVPPFFGLGTSTTVPGIVFTASDQSSSPGGQFSFVQLIVTYLTTRNDSVQGPCTETTGTGLDNFYPYGNYQTDANSAEAADGPEVGFLYTDEEITTTQSYTMYAMWTPTVTPSIPVPIGNISWQWYGDAVMTSTNTWGWNTSSNVPNPSSSSGAESPGPSYPRWTTVGTNIKNPCH